MSKSVAQPAPAPLLIISVKIGNVSATMRRLPDGRYLLAASNTWRIRTGREEEIWQDLRQLVHTGHLPNDPR